MSVYLNAVVVIKVKISATIEMMEIAMQEVFRVNVNSFSVMD